MLSEGEFQRSWFWWHMPHLLFNLCICLPQVLSFGSADAVSCEVNCKSDPGGNLDEK